MLRSNALANQYTSSRRRMSDESSLNVGEKSYENVCRVCHKEGKHSLSDELPVFSKVLTLLTGIEIHSKDCFHKLLCKACYILLNGAVYLHQSARHSSKLLNHHSLVKSEVEENEIELESIELKPFVDSDPLVDDNGSESQVKKDIIVESNDETESRMENVSRRQSNGSESLKEKDIKSESHRENDMDSDESDDPQIENDTIFESNVSESQVKNKSVLDGLWDFTSQDYFEDDVLFCKSCVQQFNTKDEYKQHKLTEKHRAFRKECSVCHKMVTNLQNHILIHSETCPHVCDICGREFRVLKYLNNHKLVHDNSFPHQCKLCPYKARSIEYLKVHMRTHTGERPYRCTQCPGKFINQSNLKKHMLTHKKKEFQCDICFKYLSTKKYLEIHIKVIHVGMRELQCETCGKTFGDKKHLRRHNRSVHKIIKTGPTGGRIPLYLQLQGNEGNDEQAAI